MKIQTGDIVVTNYDTGPYVIVEILGPFTEPHYLDQINGVDRDSEPHYSLRCGWAGPRAEGHCYKDDYWLNGFRLDGTSVWDDDRLTIVGYQPGVQLGLLEAA
jgi:hypothetical protein